MEHGGHHGEEHGPPDPLGQRVAVLASIFAVLLAIVTILSHRAHTDAVMTRSEENDTWGYFQAKKLKGHSFEVGRDMLGMLAAKGEAVDKKVEDYTKKIEKYNEESNELEKKGKEEDAEVKHIEKRAVFFDLGEGLIEIGLVMCSLYFLGKKKLFPVVGTVAGLTGIVLGAYGLLL